MKEVNIKQSLATPPDMAYIKEMSLELVNGAAKFVDYKLEESAVEKVLKRYSRQRRENILRAQEE